MAEEVLSSVVVAYHLPNRGKRGVRLWDCWEEEIKVLVSRVETMTKVMTIDGVKGLFESLLCSSHPVRLNLEGINNQPMKTPQLTQKEYI